MGTMQGVKTPPDLPRLLNLISLHVLFPVLGRDFFHEQKSLSS